MRLPRGWKHHIDLHDIWQDETPDFKARRDAIVTRIKASTAWDEDDERLVLLVDELGDCDHEDEFDWVWDEFYDWADEKRVWVELWTPVVKPVQEDLQRLLTELKGP